MSISKQNSNLVKLFSLLSVVRGYNILVLIAAQYLAAIFIFSPEKSLKHIIFDIHLLYLILATASVVSAGYIINSFYDSKLDLINRPLKTGLDSQIKEETKLSLYFLLNFVGAAFGFLISWRAAVFFSVYIFGIWIYSHKLKKYALTGLISATVLTVLPFFAVFVYFKNFQKVIFVHALFLFLVIMVRQLIKNLENIKGAIANNYKTFPVVYGERKTKQFSLLLLVFTLIPMLILFRYTGLGYMRYYFHLAMITLIFVGWYLWFANSKNQYRLLHNILKALLLIGILGLIFIDTSLLVEKVIEKLN
jgi:4-hydroxybenzoate polyprenyltransferase